MSQPDTDLFGETVVQQEQKRKKLGPRGAQHNQRLRDIRLAAANAITNLFAEVEPPVVEIDPDDDSEGKPNPKFDYRLRVTKLKIDHCKDSVLESFIRDVHEQCLIQNLRYLESEDKKESVRKEKIEILKWAFCVDNIGGVDQRKIVCSFHNCCICAQVDPDEIRSALLQRPSVRHLLVVSHLVLPRDLPPLRNTKVVRYADIVGKDDNAPYPKCYMVGV